MIVHYGDRTLCYDTSQCFVASPQWYVKIFPRTIKNIHNFKLGSISEMFKVRWYN